MFRTANGGVLPREFQLFFKMNENFIFFERNVSIKTLAIQRYDFGTTEQILKPTRVVIG